LLSRELSIGRTESISEHQQFGSLHQHWDASRVNSAYVAHPWVAEGTRRVRFGLYGVLKPDWTRTLEWAQLAEEVGFDSFWLADHPVAHV
jgi:hypothetical protein